MPLPLLITALSLNALFFELLITRIFAVTLFATQAHLALGLAMLGMSFGALIHYLFPQILLGRRSQERQQIVSLLQAVATIAAVCAALYFPVIEQPTSEIVGYNQRASLADVLLHPWWFGALLVTLTIPFLITGALFASFFQRHAQKSSNLYAADLIGGALGALIFIPLLSLFSGPDAVFASSLLVSAVVLGLSMRTRIQVSYLSGAVLCGCALAVIVSQLHGTILQVRAAAGFPENLVKYQLWTPLTRLAILPDVRNPGSDIMLLDNASVSQIVTTQKERERLKDQGTRSLVYQFVKPPARIAVLAASAGPEVAAAQAFGHTDIDAVDVAGEIFDVVAERYRNSPLNPFTTGNTRRVKADGRAAILHADAPYDIIQMVHANLWSTAGLLANTWSPSLLETVEAFETYLDHLSPEGVISMSRGVETDYIVRSAAQALRTRGINDPEHYIMLLHAKGVVLLVKRAPWTDADYQRLVGVLQENYPNEWEIGIDPRSDRAKAKLSELEERTPLLTDDKPFIDEPAKAPLIVRQILEGTAGYRGNYLPVVYRTLLVQFAFVIAAAVLLSLLWAVYALRQRQKTGYMILFYVSLLGYGYLAIEIILIHRLVLFIGHPTYAITLVVFAMLLFSGLGSFYTKRVKLESTSKFLILALTGIILAGLLDIFAVPGFLYTYLHGLSLTARCILVTGLLAPLAFLMGMPFPTALRILGKTSAASIPWAWAVNGLTSILAGLVTIVVARLFGYSYAGMIALLAYGCAMLCIPSIRTLMRSDN